jgi:hypothetical protein
MTSHSVSVVSPSLLLGQKLKLCWNCTSAVQLTPSPKGVPNKSHCGEKVQYTLLLAAVNFVRRTIEHVL